MAVCLAIDRTRHSLAALGNHLDTFRSLLILWAIAGCQILLCRRLSLAPLHLQVYFLPVCYQTSLKASQRHDVRAMTSAFILLPMQPAHHLCASRDFCLGLSLETEISVFPWILSWYQSFCSGLSLVETLLFHRSYPDASSFPNISRRSKFQAPSTEAIHLSSWLLIWPRTRTNSMGRPLGFGPWPSMFTIPLDTIGLLGQRDIISTRVILNMHCLDFLSSRSPVQVLFTASETMQSGMAPIVWSS